MARSEATSVTHSGRPLKSRSWAWLQPRHGFSRSGGDVGWGAGVMAGNWEVLRLLEENRIVMRTGGCLGFGKGGCVGGGWLGTAVSHAAV